MKGNNRFCFDLSNFAQLSIAALIARLHVSNDLSELDRAKIGLQKKKTLVLN